MTTAIADALDFFRREAGFSYAPATETPEQGRERCARELADAEARLHAGPYYVDHVPDDESWDGDVPWSGPLWIVRLWSVAGTGEPQLLGSLGSVGCDDGHPYLRVVAAQLAAEHLPAE